MAILPRETGVAYDPTQTMVGSGAWMWEELRDGVSWKVQRNPGWHNAPLPYFDGVEDIVLESAQQLTQFQAGNIDFASTIGPDSIPGLLRDFPDGRVEPRKSLGFGYISRRRAARRLRLVGRPARPPRHLARPQPRIHDRGGLQRQRARGGGPRRRQPRQLAQHPARRLRGPVDRPAHRLRHRQVDPVQPRRGRQAAPGRRRRARLLRQVPLHHALRLGLDARGRDHPAARERARHRVPDRDRRLHLGLHAEDLPRGLRRRGLPAAGLPRPRRLPLRDVPPRRGPQPQQGRRPGDRGRGAGDQQHGRRPGAQPEDPGHPARHADRADVVHPGHGLAARLAGLQQAHPAARRLGTATGAAARPSSPGRGGGSTTTPSGRVRDGRPAAARANGNRPPSRGRFRVRGGLRPPRARAAAIR